MTSEATNGRVISGYRSVPKPSRFWQLQRSIVVVMAITVFSAGKLLCAQRPSGTVPKAPEASRIFATQCAGCHGMDARGTDQGPALVGNRGLSRRSVSWIRHTIRSGIPSGGMPAFNNLPANEVDALAAFVHSLNSPAAEAAVAGDKTVGERYFFGTGNCSTCHMVDGRGKAVGPDLSNLANEMTVGQIRSSLLHPSGRITPGYGLVTVRLRDGRTIRGFARNKSGVEIVVQDLEGQFHLLQMNEVSVAQEEKQSLMPPVEASPEDLQNLIAYLSRLTGVKPGTTTITGPASPRGISWSRILHPRRGDWLTYNGNLNGNRYSDLTQINARNASQLRLKWIVTIPIWKQFLPDTAYLRHKIQSFAVETTPLVVDGIMYVTGPHETLALDARTGQEIWDYRRPRPPEPNVSDAALGKNRGVAILGDDIFKVTQDAHLLALNRTTGKPVWEVTMAPKGQVDYGATVAPLVVKNMVVAGITGGDWPGVRGFVAAYRASDGKPMWRFNTIPANGTPAAKTWGGNLPANVGGGGTWVTGSYDQETNTLYWTTGNPYPDGDGGVRPGDNLYTDCILALNPDTGTLKWYYQVTPHDTHDWDATAPVVLVDTKYQGEQRKLLLFTNKNGFFYVLDRTNGHVLLATPFVRVTWASGIGPDGRPELVPEDGSVCPGDVGTNWGAKAFSPLTHLYYVTALEKCVVKVSSANESSAKSKAEPARRYVRALDIDSGKLVWQKAQSFGIVSGESGREETASGVLATASGLLFYVTPLGHVVAADAQTGKTLWYFPASAVNMASPMTYLVDGKQYLAVAVGPNILCFDLP